MASNHLELPRAFDRVGLHEARPLADGLTHGSGIGPRAPLGRDAATHERVASLHNLLLLFLGMSRPLLKFSGGSADDYATFSASFTTKPSC